MPRALFSLWVALAIGLPFPALAQAGPRRAPVLSATTDPLAGLSFAIRLQTCKGFGPTPWAPFGLYKDTACTTPATASGDSIAAWRDELSGSGLTVIQATSGARPTLYLVNGKPVERFDGVDDVLTRSDAFAPSGTALYVAVAKCATASFSSGQYASIFHYGTNSTGSAVFYLFGTDAFMGTNGIGASQYGDAFGVAGYLQVWLVASLTKPGTTGTWAQWINGASAGSKSMTTNTTLGGAGFAVGANNANLAGQYLNGDIAALFFSTDSSNPTRSRVENLAATIRP